MSNRALLGFAALLFVFVSVQVAVATQGSGSATTASHKGSHSKASKDQLRRLKQRLKALEAVTQSPAGPQGAQGPKGDPGQTGAPGPPGPLGPSEYAEFYALMPPDNAATVAVGGAVDFPNDGPNNGTILRTGPDSFNLPAVGTYRVAFSVSVTEAGQLGLALDSGAGATELPYTVSGRATGTSLIAGESLITTTTTNSVVSLVNPSGNSTALTITPLAGGTHPVAASLVIERLR